MPERFTFTERQRRGPKGVSHLFSGGPLVTLLLHQRGLGKELRHTQALSAGVNTHMTRRFTSIWAGILCVVLGYIPLNLSITDALNSPPVSSRGSVHNLTPPY